MKIGAISYLWAEEFGVEHCGILPRLKEAGLDGIEIGILAPASFPAKAIRRELEKTGLECTTCAVIPPGASLISDDAEQRRKALAHLEECIKLAADAGSRILAGPMYSPVGYFSRRRRTADEWKRGVEGWQELAPIAAKNNMPIAIEPLNRFETYFLNTIADTAEFCNDVGDENVGLLTDTFHANIEEKSIGRALRQAGKHLKHVHTCENDRGIPGTGNVNWPEFFETIKALSYDGWMVIESFSFSMGQLAAAASIWRDIERDPESVAFDGVKFLRKMIAA
ncbi:MAG TPA: sugar phosphate isomerase/epimerase family protein [Candidatus Acidoferrales bacterium]|nr:sugar phosphate isomerase/epimerase family protein [Candidatus Acidoferrales bacterium]